MSFSRQVKQEICKKEPRNPSCVVAACYGIACFGRSFDTKGVVLHTENPFIAQWAKAVFLAAGIEGNVTAKGGGSSSLYEFAVKDPYEVEKMLATFGHTGEETAVRIHSDNFNCDGCFSWFTTAAFLCCGTVVNPAKGYALEFVSSRFQVLKDFAALLDEKGFASKRTVRNGLNVLYFKASGQIEDILTYMGATRAAMEIMSQKVYKDFRNKANRITNCESANIDKIVAASMQVTEAIQTLKRHDALQALSPPLQEAVALKEKYPELSLAELAAVSPQPVSKSGLSHRYKKILQIAEKLQTNT
ncbi:MAG: DNA-binding protein WhiA [Oscillospiraceae bacterium]